MPERGPASFREEDLDFSFDASWQVCSQWDRESVYEDLKAQASGSKGVDFVALRSGALYLIEVKDYRTSEQLSSTREKLVNDGDPLADIVARKARDTVAGIVGATRVGRDALWRGCAGALLDPDLWVILWIEHADVDASDPVRRKRAKVGAAVTVLPGLKKRCRWLGARTMICSRTGAPLPGVTVKSVAGAARTRGMRP